MREQLVRGKAALLPFLSLFFLSLLLLAAATPSWAQSQVTIAQISDTHLGEPHAPHAADNVRRIVDMVNARHPDAVVLSGDIGENPDEWKRARQILKGLHAPLYYVPGNHDVHSNDVSRYRDAFGADYYRFEVKGVTFLVINSQLLGNFDQFDAQSPPPLPPQTAAESEKMLAWLAKQAEGQGGGNRQRDRNDSNNGDDSERGGRIVIGIQHISVFRNGNLPPDPKPYWVINEPYRQREMDLLHKIGVRHMLVGHWHVGSVFQQGGITWHVAPSTSRPLPWSSGIGFAMHTISRDGDVRTEFVTLNAEP